MLAHRLHGAPAQKAGVPPQHAACLPSTSSGRSACLDRRRPSAASILERAPCPNSAVAANAAEFTDMTQGGGRGRGKKQPVNVRVDAATCYIQAGNEPEHKARAASLFCEQHPEAVSRPADFCLKWGEQFKETGSVLDAPRSGRPLAVSEEQALRASKLLKAGAKPNDPLQKFDSMKNACKEKSELEGIRQAAGCSHRTLLSACYRADPSLSTRLFEHKLKASAANVAKRVEVSKWSLRKAREDPTYFRCAGQLGQWHPAAPSGTPCWLFIKTTAFQAVPTLPLSEAAAVSPACVPCTATPPTGASCGSTPRSTG